MKKYRIAFMGTPDFACPSLEALFHDPEIEIPLVISQPDTKRGRKMQLMPSAVKKRALELGLKVETPLKVSDADYIEKLKGLDLDAVVVLAYGQLLKQDLLDVLPDKFINIHASLLPRWRGAAPIQRAVMEGDEFTGISFQIMRLKLDSGPVIFEKKIEIGQNTNSLELQDVLSNLHIGDLCCVLKSHINGESKPVEQDETLVTYAKKIEKMEGGIDWSKPALEIHNQVRGLQWGPGAYTIYNGKRLKISQTSVVRASSEEAQFELGQIARIETLNQNPAAVFVSTKKDLLVVEVLQPEGKAKMKSSDFINGYGLTLGQRFS